MEIVWSSLALEHLAHILEYVEDHFGILVSQDTHTRIMDKVGQLKAFPQVGHLDKDLSAAVNGLEVRHLILAPNVLYYLIDEDEVVIAAIVHSKQSPETIRKIVNRFLEHYN